MLASIARHASTDIKEFKVSDDSASCSYTPFDRGGVINAAAYRAFLLTSASQAACERRVSGSGGTESQFRSGRSEPGWLLVLRRRWRAGLCRPLSYLFRHEGAGEDSRAHGHERCLAALAKGVDYYLTHLFDSDGLPKPFAKAPRLTMYKRELYDCAECINLCLLLRDRFPQLEATLDTVVGGSCGTGSSPMARSDRASCWPAGTTCRCTAGRSRRCSGASRSSFMQAERRNRPQPRIHASTERRSHSFQRARQVDRNPDVRHRRSVQLRASRARRPGDRSG